MKKLLIMLAIFGMSIAANAQTKTDSTTVQKDSMMSKITELESIASGVKNGYLLIEKGVVKGYNAMENGIVKGVTSVNDAITLRLFDRDGETIEQTKPGSMPTRRLQEHEARRLWKTTGKPQGRESKTPPGRKTRGYDHLLYFRIKPQS